MRPGTPEDDAFLYDVFCTNWENEIAALPDPKLVNHFLRIQFTAQESRLEDRYPSLQRYVVLHDGAPAGRLYLQRDPDVIHAVEMTMLPHYRSLGIGSQVCQDMFAEARENEQKVSLRVGRGNTRAVGLYASLGFRLVSTDDLDCYFEWTAREASVFNAAALADAARI
ncbi:MAG: GNAT family N-acetyltransferase [Nocardioidaceae bacterium]